MKQARYEDIEPIEGMDLLAGNDDVLAEVMDMGGTGGILRGLAPGRPRDAADDRRARPPPRDPGRAARPLQGADRDRNPIPIKAAVNMIGLEVGGLRLPLVEASEDERAVIREALERHNLLAAV